jgi:molybdopterin synthase sulfur carrier subunit
MRLLYFALLRERIGTGAEEVELPAAVATATELVAWLGTRGPGYAAGFATPALIRCAIDQEFQPLSAPIAGAQEIAFFPPMTGG